MKYKKTLNNKQLPWENIMNICSKEHKLISVIVPIYKVEEYLRRGIDSILAQDYPNIEVILVDDGSPDNCGKICDEYAKQDKRIRVIHNLRNTEMLTLRMI